MQQLAPVDANFLYAETASVLNHIASVQRFKLPETTTSVEQFIAGLKSFMSKRLHLVPYLRRKLQVTPAGFDHPFWITDNQFDINNHIVEIKLPSSSEAEQHAALENLVAKLHSQPMDRTKPLWTIYVITGFSDGSVAYYNQAHHACLDGMGGQAATMLLMDNSPAHREIEQPLNTQLELDEPEDNSLGAIFTACFTNLAKFQIDTLPRTMGMLESAGKMLQRAVDPAKSFGAMNDAAPQTSFNKAIGLERSYACDALDLAAVKRIAKSMDVTINDVFMSLCSGALRRHLIRDNKLPDRSLIAGCPVSLRKPSDTGLGNNVTLMQVSLASHINDPRVRLLAIKASSKIGKQVTADMAAGFEPNVSLPGLPWQTVQSASLFEQLGMANYTEMPFNLVISNVPGPRQRLYSNGAEMMSHYPVSIPTHGLGINITVQSYDDKLFFAITACKQALPNASLLKQDLLEEFEVLSALLAPTSVQKVENCSETPLKVAAPQLNSKNVIAVESAIATDQEESIEKVA